MVMVCEFVVDWIKHAFITRFNEVPAEVYKNYTIFLAYDLAQTKQKHVSKSKVTFLFYWHYYMLRRQFCLEIEIRLSSPGSACLQEKKLFVTI